MTSSYKKPLPVPEHPAVTSPFWAATRRHDLAMPRCKHCQGLFWYPREQCPICFSQDLDWVLVSGRGRIYAYTIVYQAAHPEFQKEAPYILAAIDLDEGPRIISNVTQCPLNQVSIGMEVTAVFDDVTPEWTLVKFTPSQIAYELED